MKQKYPKIMDASMQCDKFYVIDAMYRRKSVRFPLFTDTSMLMGCLMLQLLYIDLRPGQTCHSKDGGSAYSIGGGELGWQCGTGIKSHGTLTDWCTGRQWPVSCMTVISASRRSNMPFQGRRKWYIPMASYGEILSGWLNYYITRWRQDVS